MHLLYFFYIINICILVFFVTIGGGRQYCNDNRKIYQEKTGIIHDGPGNHKDSQRCEWLIKGDISETITVVFHSFYTECAYDSVFVHDGDSRSSKLLASISGKHSQFSLTSTTHQVFIVLHSDSNLNYDGFNLTYSISKCPSNCSSFGACEGQVCQCFAGHYGNACQYEWCREQCHQADHKNNKCDVGLKKCNCASNYYGESCSLENTTNANENSWHTVSSYSSVFIPHAGHVSGYYQAHDVMLVHGGYDLNEVYDDLFMFTFLTNEWTKLNVAGGVKPSARQFHSGVVYKDMFIIFGGQLMNKELSNELWMFSLKIQQWSLLSNDSRIPKTASHTLTLAGTKLFLFGGYKEEYEISYQMYIYDLELNLWLIQPSVYGKASKRYLVAHTACYYPRDDVIYIFGGVHLKSITSIPEFSNQLLMYDIKSFTWHDLKPPSTAPPPMSYHTAVIVGDYMTVQGGRFKSPIEKSNFEVSDKTYFYNLKCNTWVDESTLTKLSPVLQSDVINTKRYDHTAIIKDEQTVVLIGGLNGAIVLQDVVIYKPPHSVVKINSVDNELLSGMHCQLYDKSSCTADPSCLYCLTDNICYSSTQPPSPILPQPPVKCLKKKHATYEQTCIKTCSLLTTCESCVHHTGCLWYSIDTTCYTNDTTVKLLAGWWGFGEKNKVLTADKCQTDDKPPGLTYVGYYIPKSSQYPDDVKIVDESKYVVDLSKLSSTTTTGVEIYLKGQIYPYYNYSDATKEYHYINVRGTKMKSNLLISETAFDTLRLRPVVLRRTLDENGHDGLADGISGRMFPFKPSDISNSSGLWYTITSLSTVEKSSSKFSYFEILWNHTDPTYQAFPISRTFLQPFSSTSCKTYVSCTACISDQACGWCKIKHECMFRRDWNTCVHPTTNVTQYLARNQTDCDMCNDYFDCNQCKQDGFCAWELDIISTCMRVEFISTGFKKYAAKQVGVCPVTCKSLSAPKDCLMNFGCIWCTGMEMCIPHSQYLIQNHRGQCYTFYDRLKDHPVSCDEYTSCDKCLTMFTCGWCYDKADPRNGRCRSGDYASGQCANLNITSNEVLWSYDQCPDIDECSLGIHACQNNSYCLNTNGGYSCPCNQGYKGNGKEFCEKTCWPTCIHGNCNTTNYTCQCDLGWIGTNCSTDCGCNGHSTCIKSIGVCDKCQEYTYGTHCEYCVNGSYGNATSSHGCRKCQCNGHGDPALNHCNITTGECSCLSNTAGFNCGKCKEGHVGNPSKGICYLPCSLSTVHSNATFGYLTASNNNYMPEYVRCLWTITATSEMYDNLLYRSATSASNILLTLKKFNISCFDSHIYIYDGVLPNPRITSKVLNSKFSILGDLCGAFSEDKSFRSTTGVMSILYEGRSSDYGAYGNDLIYPGFLATYESLECPLSCKHQFVCKIIGVNSVCTCPDDKYGDICEYEKCPDNCFQSLGQGSCDLDTFKCKCSGNFLGNNCNLTKSNNKYIIDHLENIIASDMKQSEMKRFGSTMVEHNNQLYIVGGFKLTCSLMIHCHIASMQWNTIVVNKQPANRYYHCVFIYKSTMFIHGGITDKGYVKDLWKYHFSNSTWDQVNYGSIDNGGLALHTCTVVDDQVYMIGGYKHGEGINEYIITIDLITYRESIVKLSTSHQPTALYGHVSIYDEATKYIYSHGGIAFYKDKIQISNRIYGFDLQTNSWQYIETSFGQNAPRLLGHVAHRFDDVIYFIGGYNGSFNEHVYIWKINCNHWTKVQRNTVDWILDGNTNVMFASSVAINNSIIIHGGYDGVISSQTVSFTPSNDSCGRHNVESSCLQEFHCNWCSNNATRNNSYCFSQQQTNKCTATDEVLSTATTCNINHMQNKKCDNYTSCTSCLGVHPQGRSECQWCRCASPSMCIPRNKGCLCEKNTHISSCHEASCETSTCLNCQQCYWTNHLVYVSETKRFFSYDRTVYNCFSPVVYGFLDKHQRAKLDEEKTCPKECSTHTTCATCLSSKGDYADSRHCYWSEHSSQCISEALLPMTCLNGTCSRLYTPGMTCPLPCTKYTTCLSCLQQSQCGWCAQGNMGKGECTLGGLVGPSRSIDKCGVSMIDMDITMLISNSSFNYTWSYAMCPLENECLHGHHDCSNVEVCQDIPVGYKCNCLDGYERIKGKCEPICSMGCANGMCVKPDVCNCTFGWTSSNCTVLCQCNGHSNCKDENNPDVCLKCYNNTQGATCNECKPLYVKYGNLCTPCFYACNRNSEICMNSHEIPNIPDHKLYDVDYLRGNLARGAVGNKAVICIGCMNNSEGDQCQSCVDGYFSYSEKCTRCFCNDHSTICNKNTGEDCQCRHNTKANPACKSNCFREQCTNCEDGFIGDPRNGKQCYKKVDPILPELLVTHAEQTEFFVAKPGYTNVNMRLHIDVIMGEFDIFMADTDNRFGLYANSTDSSETLKLLSEVSTRKRRDNFFPNNNKRRKRDVVVYVSRTNANTNSMLTFTEFTSEIQYVKGVTRRLVITIPHVTHDLSKRWFYIALVAKNNTGDSLNKAFVYYRQDLPRIDLLLFFSVLIIVLLLILCGFILGWQLRLEMIDNGNSEQEKFKLHRMEKRPLHTYILNYNKNENINIIRKRKTKNPNSPILPNINPIASQITEDNLASIVTVFVHYPSNEQSSLNLALGCGICLAHNQQLVQVRTSNTGVLGKEISTRFMTTST